MKLPVEDYGELVDRVRDRIRLHIPPGSVVLIASKGDEALVRLDGYRAWHFPQTETGVYAGHYPADSAAAIGHLRDLQSCGAQYLVFPWTARWWLDHYVDLARHLTTVHASLVADDGVCLIFELREDAASGADGADDTARINAAAGLSEEIDATLATPLRLAAPRPAAPRRILTILARFGTNQYPRAEPDIDEIFERQLPEVQRTVIVVDNASPRHFVERRPNGALIGGDNQAREFSAFDCALDFVGRSIWSYDLVHFATSAFRTLYVAYLDRFDAEVLGAINGRPVCLGHVDCYNEAIEVMTYRSQHWVRSCFFFLSPTEVKALGRFAFVNDGHRFFSGNPDAPFRPDAPISPNYREYIAKWLAGVDIGQGVAWHSGFALTDEALEAFEHKTVSILNEQLLGIRLRALGCRLIDVTWLSRQLRRQSPAEIPWSTSWRQQLANRDADSLRVPIHPGAALSTV
jgi:hypothetical protein